MGVSAEIMMMVCICAWLSTRVSCTDVFSCIGIGGRTLDTQTGHAIWGGQQPWGMYKVTGCCLDGVPMGELRHFVMSAVIHIAPNEPRNSDVNAHACVRGIAQLWHI